MTAAEQPSDEPGDADGPEALLQATSLAQAGSDNEDMLEQLPLAARLADKQQQQQQRMLADAAPSARPPSGSPTVAVPGHPPPASGNWLYMFTCNTINVHF